MNKRGTNPRRRNGNARNKLIARHRAQAANGEPCCICGRPIDTALKSPDPMSMVVDETIPVARGGDPLSWAITKPAHRWCNQIKGVHTLEWAQREVQRLLTGRQTQQAKPTAMPFRRLGL